MIRSTTRSTLAVIAAAALAVGLGGCGADDVELNGKIFDMVGIGSKSGGDGKEPKMVARAPIVLPPNVDRLPPPGAQPAAQDAQLALIADPDRKAEVNQADLERQQAEFCDKNYDRGRDQGDRQNSEDVIGPLGSCRGSALSAFGGLAGILGQTNAPQEGQVEKQ
ncbi:MAG: hypothetical protein ACT4N2_03410 [Hyphomicrobium sp.]